MSNVEIRPLYFYTSAAEKNIIICEIEEKVVVRLKERKNKKYFNDKI